MLIFIIFNLTPALLTLLLFFRAYYLYVISTSITEFESCFCVRDLTVFSQAQRANLVRLVVCPVALRVRLHCLSGCTTCLVALPVRLHLSGGTACLVALPDAILRTDQKSFLSYLEKDLHIHAEHLAYVQLLNVIYINVHI